MDNASKAAAERATDYAMTRAGELVATVADQFALAGSFLHFDPDALAVLGGRLLAKLIEAPLRQGHPLDGLTPTKDGEATA